MTEKHNIQKELAVGLKKKLEKEIFDRNQKIKDAKNKLKEKIMNESKESL